MITRITLSFPCALSSMGDVLTALVEIGGVNISDIQMRDRPIKDMGAVAELLPPSHTNGKALKQLTQKAPKRKFNHHRARFEISEMKPLEVKTLMGQQHIRGPRYASLKDVTKARSLGGIPKHAPEDFDTLISTASPSEIRNMDQSKKTIWIRGDKEKLEQVKYIALYETKAEKGRQSIIGYSAVTNIEHK